jgi:hypothetical protein
MTNSFLINRAQSLTNTAERLIEQTLVPGEIEALEARTEQRWM